jgi:hypothetical protein
MGLTLDVGRNVIVEQSYGGPKITKGVWVALYTMRALAFARRWCQCTAISLKDKFENLGARYVSSALYC